MAGLGFADEHSFKAIGDAALGAELSNPWWAQLNNPTNNAFVAAFRKKFGRNPVFYAAFMYDVINLLNAAVKEAGGIKDKNKFRAALRRANFKSVAATSASTRTISRSKISISARWSR